MGEGVGVKGLGREIGPIRVERVVSVHSGLSGSERGERAVLPMSLHIESAGNACSNNVLCGEGGGAGSDRLSCMHAERGGHDTLLASLPPGTLVWKGAARISGV